MIALLLLSATAVAQPPALNPLVFFTGGSQGRGTIKIVFKTAQPLHVVSRGQADGKGGIILDQQVRQGDAPPKTRRWLLKPTSATTLTGTLSDASGPVTGTVKGAVMTLAYPMKGGLEARQTLTLQPGGKILHNIMTVRKFGMTVARIDETITKE